MDNLILGNYPNIRVINSLHVIKYNNEKNYEDKKIHKYSIEKLIKIGSKIGYKNDTLKNKYYIYYDPYINNTSINNNKIYIDFIYSFQIEKKNINYIDLMCCDTIKHRIFFNNNKYYFNNVDNGYFINYYYGFNLKIYFNSLISENEFETFKLYTKNIIKNMEKELYTQMRFNNIYKKMYKIKTFNTIIEYGKDDDSDY